jgi:hypothetical protein
VIHRKGLAIVACAVPLAYLGACQSLGLSNRALTASLRTDSAQVSVRRSGNAYFANIGFVYTNTTSTPVAKGGCGFPPFPILEKQVGGQWVRAYDPTYLMCSTKPDFTLPSGKSYHGVLQFIAYERGHNNAPTLDVDSIDGVYRLRWDFNQGTDDSAKARRVVSTSNEFRMVLIVGNNRPRSTP